MRTRFAADVLIALAVVAVWPQPAAGQSAVDNARQSLAAELRDRGSPFSLQDVDYIALIAHRSSTLVRLLQEY